MCSPEGPSWKEPRDLRKSGNHLRVNICFIAVELQGLELGDKWDKLGVLSSSGCCAVNEPPNSPGKTSVPGRDSELLVGRKI